MHGPPPRLTATDGATDSGRPAATAKTTTGSASSPAHSGSRRLPRSGCLAGATFTARRQRRRRLHARAARTNPLRGQPALEKIRSRVGVAASRDAVIGLEQGRISRSWQPDATISRWRPWPNPGFRMFRVSPARMGRDRDAPAGPLGQAPSDRGRQRPPRPGCLIPCRPVSPVSPLGRTEPGCYYISYYSARHAKGPLPAGKGP